MRHEMKEAFSSYPQVQKPEVVHRIGALMSSLPKLEARVAQFMLLNVADLGFETGASIAHKAGTSEVTVGRLLRRLGYKGMPGLKRALRESQIAGHAATDGDGAAGAANGGLKTVLDAEIRALVTLFEQFDGARWDRLVEAIGTANRVYVTGFQSVRGAAEDFVRRLSLARDDVRFLSAHDSMLGEWIGGGEAGSNDSQMGDCLIVIDVVPYAREASELCELCRDTGRNIIVVSDEFCHWAQEFTDLIIHAPSRSGLFLESSGALVAALNVIVHAVAQRDPEETQRRLEHWQATTRRLKMF